MLFGMLQFVHVLTMFAAVAAAIVPGLLLHRVARMSAYVSWRRVS